MPSAEPPDPNPTTTPTPDDGWAEPVDELSAERASAQAINLNVEGRQPVNPLKGFGQLWQKTYQVALTGVSIAPQEVMATWKAHFPDFQPPDSRFFPPKHGIKPGEVFLINAETPGGDIYTGMMVMYVDDVSLTLMTPQGHPESGWITFSTFDRDGVTVAQIESLARANDPLYELAFRLVGSKVQERIWRQTLGALARHYGVPSRVTLSRKRIDRRLQWSQALNVRHNAQIRSLFYKLLSPLRRIFRRGVR